MAATESAKGSEPAVQEFEWNLKLLLTIASPEGIPLTSISATYEKYFNKNIEPAMLLTNSKYWHTVFETVSPLYTTFELFEHNNVTLSTYVKIRTTENSNNDEEPDQLIKTVLLLANYKKAVPNTSTMTVNTAKEKCHFFLNFLLELSAKQNQTVARNVRNLIQELVNGEVTAEGFSERLQKEVNSQPQPALVGFIKQALPHLKLSLANKELCIAGIKPPPLPSITSESTKRTYPVEEFEWNLKLLLTIVSPQGIPLTSITETYKKYFSQNIESSMFLPNSMYWCTIFETVPLLYKSFELFEHNVHLSTFVKIRPNGNPTSDDCNEFIKKILLLASYEKMILLTNKRPHTPTSYSNLLKIKISKTDDDYIAHFLT